MEIKVPVGNNDERPALFMPGEKVTYIGNPFKRPERGIVKSATPVAVFVVFHCAEDWDNYADYTAALCRPFDLIKGWAEKLK